MNAKNTSSKKGNQLPDSLFVNIQKYDPITKTSTTVERVLVTRYDSPNKKAPIYKGFVKDGFSVSLFEPLF